MVKHFRNADYRKMLDGNETQNWNVLDKHNSEIRVVAMLNM